MRASCSQLRGVKASRTQCPRPHGPQQRRALTRSAALPPSLVIGSMLGIGEHFQGVSSLMPGEVATLFSAVIALGSVCLNLYGGLISERKRAELQKELVREKAVIEMQAELRSVVARYRGPLLEAAVDLEQRIYHLVTTTVQFLGFVEVVRREGPRERSFLQQGNPQGTDTLNCLVEGFRYAMAAHSDALRAWCSEGDESRDHPGARSRSRPPLLLAIAPPAQPITTPEANGQLQHTLPPPSSTVAAAYSYHGSNGSSHPSSGPHLGSVLSSSSSHDPGSGGSSGSAGIAMPGGWPAAAATAAAQGEGALAAAITAAMKDAAVLDATRKVVTPEGLTRTWTPLPSQACIATASGVLDSTDLEEGLASMRPAGEAFRISRGGQRAIGSMMVTTPVGAPRHYTMSYGDFYARLRTDAYLAGWFKPLYEDMLALVSSGVRWQGQPAFPINRWTRLLLLQQLLVDTIDLLDPNFVRVPANRRVRLAPVKYGPLPNFEEYRVKLEQMEGQYSATLSPPTPSPGPSLALPFFSAGWPVWPSSAPAGSGGSSGGVGSAGGAGGPVNVLTAATGGQQPGQVLLAELGAPPGTTPVPDIPPTAWQPSSPPPYPPQSPASSSPGMMPGQQWQASNAGAFNSQASPPSFSTTSAAAAAAASPPSLPPSPFATTGAIYSEKPHLPSATQPHLSHPAMQQSSSAWQNSSGEDPAENGPSGGGSSRQAGSRRRGPRVLKPGPPSPPAAAHPWLTPGPGISLDSGPGPGMGGSNGNREGAGSSLASFGQAPQPPSPYPLPWQAAVPPVPAPPAGPSPPAGGLPGVSSSSSSGWVGGVGGGSWGPYSSQSSSPVMAHWESGQEAGVRGRKGEEEGEEEEEAAVLGPPIDWWRRWPGTM
ncbi:hypothetical protein QJQ45_013203 [Haematococcus lacustris]|nr:hypothetical protein QJQ45_013203 [Haematococcus lacustris]